MTGTSCWLLMANNSSFLLSKETLSTTETDPKGATTFHAVVHSSAHFNWALHCLALSCTVLHCLALSGWKSRWKDWGAREVKGPRPRGKPRQRRIQEDKDNKLNHNPIGICLLGFRSRGFNLWPITICPKPGRREIPHEIVRFQDNQLVLRPRRWSIEGNFPSLSKSPVQPSLVIGRVYLGAPTGANESISG